MAFVKKKNKTSAKNLLRKINKENTLLGTQAVQMLTIVFSWS